MYIVMELGGQSLDKYFNANKNNHQHNMHNFVRDIFRATALAIQQFHNAGGIHLDIKADNFIMALNDNQSEMQVNPLKSKLSLATEDYMAPEIRSKLFSNRKDNVFNL
uniref:Protein kinase domain-containing protein n=1 Tax=Meloidogyne incognita TaxID=6306 RepID=A0A914LDP4_MELIC